MIETRVYRPRLKSYAHTGKWPYMVCKDGRHTFDYVGACTISYWDDSGVSYSIKECSCGKKKITVS